MSHQFVMETQIKDKEILEQILTELGYTFVENGTLNDYHNNPIGKVDILVKVGTISSQVGFKLNAEGNSYDLTGDFFNTGETKEKFRNSIKRNYVSKKIETMLSKKRYIITEKNTEKNKIKMVARSMIA